MIEIRIHGRGGQGAVTAAEILAIAAFKEGKWAQAFAAFGPERRGAPVRAFVRIDDAPIRIRQQVYNPDIVMVMDASLTETENVEEGLKPNGIRIINGSRGGERTYTVDATSIAKELGKPVVNMVMLGALIKATSLLKAESVEEAIGERFGGQLGDVNIEAFRKGYERCKS